MADGGLKWDALTARVRARVSFKGSMRTNLIHMLDAVGLPDHLGIHSTAVLFELRAYLPKRRRLFATPSFGETPITAEGRVLSTLPSCEICSTVVYHPN
jgi:hypothetical protein